MYFTPHQNENDCDSTHIAFYVLNYFLNRVKAHSLELATPLYKLSKLTIRKILKSLIHRNRA